MFRLLYLKKDSLKKAANIQKLEWIELLRDFINKTCTIEVLIRETGSKEKLLYESIHFRNISVVGLMFNIDIFKKM